MKQRSLLRMKKPLALLISATIFSSAYATDLIITNEDGLYVEYDNATVIEKNVILGLNSYLNVGLDNHSVWNGNITESQISGWREVSLNLTNNSAWNGNITGNIHGRIVLEDSSFTGHINTTNNIDMSMLNSDFTGRIDLLGQEDNPKALIMGAYDNTKINSDINMLVGTFNLALANYSALTGNVNLNNAYMNMNLSNNSLFNGNITSYVDSQVSCACGYIMMHDSEWNGSYLLNVKEDSPFAFYQNMVFNNTKWNGNLSITADNASINGPRSTVSVQQHQTQWFGDITLTGNIHTNISLASNSLWRGNLYLKNSEIVDESGYGNSQIYLSESDWIGHIDSDSAKVDMFLFTSNWTLTGNSHIALLNITDDTTISFNSLTRRPVYHTLAIDDLVGDLNLVMRAGFFGKGVYGNDKLIITGDKNITGHAVSNNRLTVLNNGTDNTHGTEILTVVETVDGLDTFTLTSDVELGGYVYTLEQQGTNWILRPGAKGTSWVPGIDNPVLSKPANAAVNVAKVSYLLNFAETQTLYQRMGDLHQNGHDNGNVWIKAYHGEFKHLPDNFLRGFNMNYNGLQFGVDKQFELNNSRFYLGTTAGITDADPKYAGGNGSSKSYYGGIYASYLTDDLFYVDALVKYNRIKNKLDVIDTQGQLVQGQSRLNGVSASIETGKRYHFSSTKSGVYIEPQLQVTVSHQGKDNLSLSNGLDVKLDSSHSVLGRVGGQIGYQTGSDKAPTNIYAKSSYVKEFSGQMDYSLNTSNEKTSMKGEWWVNGVGVSVQPKKNHHFYLDMEQANGKLFNQHQVNVGYRFNF